jgi:hypothetical protein
VLYYAFGDALLTAEEVFEPTVFDAITGFFDELKTGGKPQSVALPSGHLSIDNVLDPSALTDVIPFSPIGPGLPLTLMIHEVYTGKFPTQGFGFKKKKPMLVTSAIKSIIVPEAKPRALNMLKKEVGPHTRPFGGAEEAGVPLIFYSPALLEVSLTLDLTMAFDDFNQDVFDQIGEAFGQAAGIPLFATQSFYLIAAGMITKLVGRIGEAIFDPSPEFKSSDQLNISLPGRPPLPAGHLLITSDDLGPNEEKFRKDHRIDPKEGKLLDSSNKEYRGDVPYVILTADGTPHEEFKKFTPTAVSAAVMSRFFNIKDNQALPLDIMIDALKLYNDIKHRTEVERIDEQIKAVPDDDPKKAEKVAALQKKKDALLANILEERLKPKA